MFSISNNNTPKLQANYKKTKMSNGLPNSPSKPIQFSGTREDNLCSKPVYEWNPFVTRKEQIEKSQNYKDVVTKWEKDAQGHMVTKVGRVVVGTGGTALGHALGHASGIPCGVPEIVGTMSGLTVENFIEPTVKLFTKPEMERQREYAIEASDVIGYGGPVEQACRRIDEKVNQGYFTWWDKKTHIGSFLKGLASRYGREQQHVKALLPKIKGEHTTRTVIVPILEDCRYANLYETRIDTTHDAAGGYYTQHNDGSITDAPIGKAVRAVREGFDSEVASGIIPRMRGGDQDRDRIAESKFRELKSKLPAIIDYLKD